VSVESVTYSDRHPHEPEIPPVYDDEGRCVICGLLVRVERAENEAHLGLASTLDLISELQARADVANTIGDEWPSYRTTPPRVFVA